MVFFEIDGKEYELKMTFKSVQHLNSLYEGGALMVIGNAFMQDLNLFTHVIHAALFHTKENFSFKKIEEEIEARFDAEELSMEYIQKVLNSMVLEHFFYRKMVEKFKKTDKKMAAALEMLMKEDEKETEPEETIS